MAVLTVAQPISSLSADTAYRYRVEATNTAGTEVGLARVFVTEAFAAASPLLDGRGWELVSPLEKGGGEVQGPGQSFDGGTIQAAALGGAFTYSSTSSFGPAQGAPAASQYIARRSTAGWTNENVTLPTVSGAFGGEPDGVPYQLFSADLARGLALDGSRCVEGLPCPTRYSLRESSSGALSSSVEESDLRFVGAATDLSQVVLSTCAALTADAVEVPAPGGCDPAQPNLYRWSSTGLDLLNLLPAATQGTPGAALAAQGSAISSDGTRAYWTLGGNLYLREGITTKQVDDSAGGGGEFEVASLTGAVAFFTKAGHLYRYDAPTDTATDLTPSGEVQGVLGSSADGSHLYYLTAGGLFLRHGATTTKVAVGADASNYPPVTGTARVTPDGSHLAFLSDESLTGYDNRDAVTGQPRTEVFLYDAVADALACASCNPTGERPLGDSTIPGATANGKGAWATRAYKPRALSDDGRRLFFDSTDVIALADTAKRPDVYEWEAQGAGSCQRAGGCIALISAGRSSEGASFLDASTSGADVFFLTPDSLVDSDLGFTDVYDAREGGGFPEPFKPIECVGDACQFLPSEPEDPEPGTLVPSGGNPPLQITKPAPTACKKGYVKKRGRCVKKARTHKKAKRHARAGRGR